MEGELPTDAPRPVFFQSEPVIHAQLAPNSMRHEEEILAVTGERMHLRGQPLTRDEWAHVRRYEWARSQIHGRVLDVASGTGYGTAMLAGSVQAFGVEPLLEAIQLGRLQHPSPAHQVSARLPSLPFVEGVFECVVSFETIEHIADDVGFVSESRRVLRPGGRLLVSTPNKTMTSPDGPPANRFHMREYFLGDSIDLLTRHGLFANVEVFAQTQEPQTPLGWCVRHTLGIKARAGRHREVSFLDRVGHGDPRVERPKRRREPMFWVISCVAA